MKPNILHAFLLLVTAHYCAGQFVGIFPVTREVPVTGGKFAIEVDAPENMMWTAVSNEAWVEVLQSANGSGIGTVIYEALPNPSVYPRKAAITIEDTVHTIEQAAQGAVLTPSIATTTANAATGTVQVAPDNGASWIAVSETPWITITAGDAGAGDGTVSYSVDAHDGITPRSGVIRIANQPFTITQTGVVVTLDSARSTIAADGGRLTALVTLADGPSWTATSRHPWITVTSGSAADTDGSVEIVVSANPTGVARTGHVDIADKTWTITQEGQEATVAPLENHFPPEGGFGSFTLTVTAGTEWSVQSIAPWITVIGPSEGSGPASIDYHIGPTSEIQQRSATITVGDAAHLVTQAATSYAINPPNRSVAATGGSFITAVSTSPGALWTAYTESAWITLDAVNNTGGNGDVIYTVAPNDSSLPRVGILTIAGHSHVVSQSGETALFSIDPAESRLGPEGGTVTVALQSSVHGASWNARSLSPWIISILPPQGFGNGLISFDVTPNPGLDARSGAVEIAGQVHFVSQDGVDQSVAFNPGEQVVSSLGGVYSVAVRAGPTMPWTALSRAPWIVVNSPASGVGDGTITYRVDTNQLSAQRTGRIDIGAISHTVVQEGPVIGLDPISRSFSAEGGEALLHILTGPLPTPWQATSPHPWVEIIESNPAANTVSYRVLKNPDYLPRTGSLHVGGIAHTINQSSRENLFANALPLNDGYSLSPWFDELLLFQGSAWIFHREHGWLFLDAYTGNSVFLWTYDMDWLWTNIHLYPAVYRFADDAWLAYLRGSGRLGTRWFFNFDPSVNDWQSTGLSGF